jgi:hypothetical protein
VLPSSTTLRGTALPDVRYEIESVLLLGRLCLPIFLSQYSRGYKKRAISGKLGYTLYELNNNFEQIFFSFYGL